MKRKLIGKAFLGCLVAMFMGIMFSMSAFADEQGRDIKEVTKIASTREEAKALIDDLRANGITCNLTVNCGSEEVVSYLKNELVSIPMAMIYKPVQLVLMKNQTTQNNNCNNGQTQQQQQNQCTQQSNNNQCKPQQNQNQCQAQQNNSCQKQNTCTTTDADKKANSACDTATSDNKCATDATRDASPKTGDNFGIRMTICLAIASLMTMGGVYMKKKSSRY